MDETCVNWIHFCSTANIGHILPSYRSSNTRQSPPTPRSSRNRCQPLVYTLCTPSTTVSQPQCPCSRVVTGAQFRRMSVGVATRAAVAIRHWVCCARTRSIRRAALDNWAVGQPQDCRALLLFSENSSTVCSAAAAQGQRGGSPQSCDAAATSPILQPGSSLQSSLWRRRRRFEGAKHQIQQNHILSKVPSTIIHTAGLRPLSFV